MCRKPAKHWERGSGRNTPFSTAPPIYYSSFEVGVPCHSVDAFVAGSPVGKLFLRPVALRARVQAGTYFSQLPAPFCCPAFGAGAPVCPSLSAQTATSGAALWAPAPGNRHERGWRLLWNTLFSSKRHCNRARKAQNARSPLHFLQPNCSRAL